MYIPINSQCIRWLKASPVAGRLQRLDEATKFINTVYMYRLPMPLSTRQHVLILILNSMDMRDFSSAACPIQRRLSAWATSAVSLRCSWNAGVSRKIEVIPAGRWSRAHQLHLSCSPRVRILRVKRFECMFNPASNITSPSRTGEIRTRFH